MSEQNARELLAEEMADYYGCEPGEFLSDMQDEKWTLDGMSKGETDMILRALSAAKEQGRREAIAEVVARVMKVIESGYRGIDKNDKCEHGRYGFEDCIACYDEAIIAALNGEPKEPFSEPDATQA